MLAIAVSGTERIRVSHYFHFKRSPKPVEILKAIPNLIPISDYVDLYLKDGTVLKQDLDSLLRATKKLNKRLHTLKVKTDKRGLLISAVLMALKIIISNRAIQCKADLRFCSTRSKVLSSTP